MEKREKKMEPIFFEPVYKKVIWGGNRISKVFNRDIKDDDIGESWELSAHKNGMSIIRNGEFKGLSLSNLFNNKEQRLRVFGSHCANLEQFPILAKFIDANKNLSIQVHPDDDYAKKYENDSGKNEVWYVLECDKGSKLIYGLKEDVKRENLKSVLENIEENVNCVDIHKGDFISIPAGTVHAIMEGTLVCEVQQSSDVTYRVYDWNRVDASGNPRQLHKEKAFDVINLDLKNEIRNYNKINENTSLYKSDIFNIDMINIKGYESNKSSEKSFIAYIVISRKW